MKMFQFYTFCLFGLLACVTAKPHILTPAVSYVAPAVAVAAAPTTVVAAPATYYTTYAAAPYYTTYAAYPYAAGAYYLRR